jgi:hypothetical protein
MYAAASFVLGRVESATPLTLFASGWIWVAVCAWLAATAATIRRFAAPLGAASAEGAGQSRAR